MSSRNLFVKNALTKEDIKTPMTHHINERSDAGTNLNCVNPGMGQGTQDLEGWRTS